MSSLNIESCHDDNFIVIGGTGSCRYDSLRCHKGRQSWHNDSLGFHTQWSYCHSQAKLLTNKHRLQLTLSILQVSHLFHRMLFPLQLMSCLRLYCPYTEQVMWPIELLFILYFLLCFDRGLIHTAVQWWKHFPRYWPFVRGIHRSPVNSPHKGQWRGDCMFPLICAWINDLVNNSEAGDLRRYRAHYDVYVMQMVISNVYILDPTYIAGLHAWKTSCCLTFKQMRLVVIWSSNRKY